MKKIVLFLISLLSCVTATAGFVYEIVVTDHSEPPPTSESLETAVEGKLLKIETAAGSRGDASEMVYRGDLREMVFIDHDKKSYYVIDEEALKALAAQNNQATSMMEQALVNVPEGQRAQFEAMMKKRMPQVQTAELPKTKLRKTSEQAEQNGYPCIRYEVLRNGQAIREVWVTDWKNVEGGDEVVDLFVEM